MNRDIFIYAKVVGDTLIMLDQLRDKIILEIESKFSSLDIPFSPGLSSDVDYLIVLLYIHNAEHPIVMSDLKELKTPLNIYLNKLSVYQNLGVTKIGLELCPSELNLVSKYLANKYKILLDKIVDPFINLVKINTEDIGLKKLNNLLQGIELPNGPWDFHLEYKIEE